MAAIPARYALERGDWTGATKLEVHQTAFPFADAITWFARGIGAARTGATLLSAEAVRQLGQLRDALTQRKEAYWSQQVDILRRGGDAWRAVARCARAEAVDEMLFFFNDAATTEKNAIT